jgi:hypothetical protein
VERAADCREQLVKLAVRDRERRRQGDQVADTANDHTLFAREARREDAERRCG